MATGPWARLTRSRITNPVWVGGGTSEAVYLTGFRVSRRHRRAIGLIAQVYARLLEAFNEELFYTTILEENEPARRLLEKRRAGLPAYEFLTGVTSLAVAPRRGPGRLPGGLRWRWARRQDE